MAAVNLFAEFQKQYQRSWQQEKILVAVSGGVDSIVLLNLLQRLAPAGNFKLAVAHVNHNLRAESVMEADYLRKFCQQAGLAFYETSWEEVPTSGVEVAAREFRYQFFAETMLQNDFSLLMTAHHGDDLAETILMKLIRGGHLENFVGISPRQPFANGQLVRPLLPFTKAELRAYAAEQQLDYFEDASNQSVLYQRNRLRQQVLPLLIEENPRMVAHLAEFSTKLAAANQLVAEEMTQLYQTLVQKQTSPVSYQLNLSNFLAYSQPRQELFWDYFFERVRSETGMVGKNSQLNQVKELLENSQAPQWQVDFADGWQLRRRYQRLIFEKSVVAETIEKNEIVKALPLPEEGIFINETSWLAIFPTDQPIPIPKKAQEWSAWQQEFRYPKNSRFFYRSRQAGDFIQLSSEMRKKIRRYFIDEKIPTEKRAEALVILSDEGQILVLVPHLLSYLSIAPETDTIHYTLLYRAKNL
ncbi:tRNA lysidine(34) synthetase TilS [Enterococcus sp. HY326]|uniref:tRNA lysidine(34) synthetase TilS n=1 Tax=Enterococcus sp. HY326 TaxID=2971265 RepID=UPI00223FA1EE|nr:tRNA lysidine(34) synthetase TilS [Enterococcus sp. HY326]